MILILCILSVVSGQVMEGLVQLDKSSIDKVSLTWLGNASMLPCFHARQAKKAICFWQAQYYSGSSTHLLLEDFLSKAGTLSSSIHAVDQDGNTSSIPVNSKWDELVSEASWASNKVRGWVPAGQSPSDDKQDGKFLISTQTLVIGRKHSHRNDSLANNRRHIIISKHIA